MSNSNESTSEKTEDATPHKLAEARKQGNVFKSPEVNTAFSLATGLLLLVSMGEIFILNILDICKKIFLSAGNLDFTIGSITENLKLWTSSTIFALSPIIIALVGVGTLASILQVGAIFTFEPLGAKFSRLNPITGFKNRFSKRILWDACKTLGKFCILSAVSYFWLIGYISNALRYSSMQPLTILKDFLNHSISFLWQLTVVLACIAIADMFYSKREYLQKLRMSKQELKEEFKRRDGDPAVKSRRRELEAELRKRSSSLNNVASADVLITNPTHFAVALKYDRLTMIAPSISGLGAGAMAKAMRDKAAACNIPIVCMPHLARQLFKSGKMDQPIPQNCFVPVAKALGQAYAQKRKFTDSRREDNAL